MWPSDININIKNYTMILRFLVPYIPLPFQHKNEPYFQYLQQWTLAVPLQMPKRSSHILASVTCHSIAVDAGQINVIPNK